MIPLMLMSTGKRQRANEIVRAPCRFSILVLVPKLNFHQPADSAHASAGKRSDLPAREQSLLIGTKVPEKRDLLTSNRRGIHCRSIQPRDLGGEGGFSPKPRPLKTKKPGCSSQFPQVCSSPPLQLGRVTWRNKVRISHALRAPASDARARIVSAMLATVRA
jgi:hypothetical protein